MKMYEFDYNVNNFGDLVLSAYDDALSEEISITISKEQFKIVVAYMDSQNEKAVL